MVFGFDDAVGGGAFAGDVAVVEGEVRVSGEILWEMWEVMGGGR